jgi:hypothetical protein
MRVRTRLLVSAAVVGSLVAPLVPGAPAGAAPPPELADAVAWLEAQQQADGGFDVAQFPGFETPDAVFALASAGQTGPEWDEQEALTAVTGVTNGAEDPLDSVDDWVDAVQGDGGATAAAKAGQAAKAIVLVAAPLGLDETDFDPADDTATPVDLAAALDAAEAGGAWTGVPFGTLAYIAWAYGALGEPVPASLVDRFAAAQHPDGGFDFTGSPDGEGFDVDITASVVIALVSGDAAGADAIVEEAVLGLAAQQQWNGEWAGPFDDGNPNSTALVILMARALGAAADDACWRDAAEPRLTGVPYPSPVRAITREQQDDGRIASPSDSFGVNTFATAQAIQALAAVDGPVFYDGPTCTQPVVAPNERIAQAYYVDLLDRPTEPGGAAYWASQFDGGMSPALLAKRFTGTSEYGRVVIERLVEELFDRPATPEEIDGAGPYVKAGFRLLYRAGIVADVEYIENAGDDEGWAEQAYLDTVGRPASPGDVEYVVDQLDAGRDHYEIARALVFSTEGRNAFVRDTYRQLLRRLPSAADLVFWSGELKRGVNPEKLVTLIIGSAEYKNSTQA